MPRRRGWTVIEGDCIEVLPTIDAESVDSIVTDPPYGLKFMGRNWDHGVPGEAFWTEAMRVAKPGAHLLAFGGTRTFHRLACAIEDAGWEIRDCIMWVYGCLSDDTEILVEGRWEPYHKAIAGRRVLCYDAAHDTFSWQRIQHLHVYDYCDTAFRVESDRTDQVVTRNHRCLVERGGAYAFEYAEDVALEREARVPVLEDLQGLLSRLPLHEPCAGGAEHDVQPGVRESHSTGSAADGASQWNVPCDMRRLRDAEVAPEGVDAEGRDANVLSPVQRETARRRVEEACRHRSCSVDLVVAGIIPSQDERAGESGMEGRSNGLQDARQLRRGAVRAVPGSVSSDGEEGRLRDGASADRGEDSRQVPVADGSRAPRGPRPAEQHARQSGPVLDEQGSQAVRGARYAVADLARMTPIHYEGIVWCVTVPTGAFVARRNGKVFVTGNSGFPKSLDVSKALDKAAGATDAARQWSGWGTALKPAWEPIIVARKPLVGTVAANVMEFGTGAINVDGCRVAHTDAMIVRKNLASNTGDIFTRAKGDQAGPTPSGRWPANLIHDGSDEVLAGFPETDGVVGALNDPKGSLGYHGGAVGAYRKGTPDSGSAARFFYCAKASKADRGADNNHPTVKPTAIMRYLCRLVTPPGGLVLDPFCGSGSTGKAAVLEGFRFRGIERESEYADIARDRIAAAFAENAK